MRPWFLAACWGWLALMSVASVLTWAAVPIGYSSDLFQGLPATSPNANVADLNAWTSHLTLLIFRLPNWLPLAAALAAVIAVYARSRGADLLLVLPKLLLFYATLHVTLFGFVVVTGSRALLGLGSFLTLLALLGLWSAVTHASRQATDFLTKSVANS